MLANHTILKSKHFLFYFLFFLIIYSCDKHEPTPQLEKQRTLRDVSIEEIPEITSILSESMGLNQSTEENRFEVNDGTSNLDLEIDWSKIVELIDTLGNTNYSIAVKDDKNAPYIFHNLIVGKTPNGDLKRPYLMTYTMSDEFKAQYDQTQSIAGFTGKVKKRHLTIENSTNSDGYARSPFQMRSTIGDDPCDSEDDIGGPGGGPPPNNDGDDNGPGGSYTICHYHWIDFEDDELYCQNEGECDDYEGSYEYSVTQSILVIDCQTYSYSNSDSDPCDEGGEVAVINSNKPCPGDPVKDPKIAPQKYSGLKGARYGVDARKKWNDDETILVDKPHYGLDIENDFGDPVFSSFDGEVVAIGFNPGGWGNWLRVKSIVNGKTIFTLYAHLDVYAADPLTNGTVTAGTIIGFAGKSGNLATAMKNGTAIQHLHIEVREGSTWGTAVKKNPEDYLSTKFDSNGNVISNCISH